MGKNERRRHWEGPRASQRWLVGRGRRRRALCCGLSVSGRGRVFGALTWKQTRRQFARERVRAEVIASRSARCAASSFSCWNRSKCHGPRANRKTRRAELRSSFVASNTGERDPGESFCRGARGLRTIFAAMETSTIFAIDRLMDCAAQVGVGGRLMKTKPQNVFGKGFAALLTLPTPTHRHLPQHNQPSPPIRRQHSFLTTPALVSASHLSVPDRRNASPSSAGSAPRIRRGQPHRIRTTPLFHQRQQLRRPPRLLPVQGWPRPHALRGWWGMEKRGGWSEGGQMMCVSVSWAGQNDSAFSLGAWVIPTRQHADTMQHAADRCRAR